MMTFYKKIMSKQCAVIVLVIFQTIDNSNAGLLDDYKYSKNYVKVGLNNEKICHPFSNKLESNTDLRNHRNSALLIKPSHVFDSWQMSYDKHCNFKIKGPKEDNLFAVVQRMSLRRNGTECLDYIVFKSEENPSKSPKKYCGKVETINGVKRYTSGLNSDEKELRKSNLLYSFEDEVKMIEEFSARGKIATEIFISKEPLKTGESLDLIIVYTPYKYCSKVKGDTDFWSDPSNPNVCINKQFVCDGYLNCASSLCNDEQNCTTIYRNVVSNEIGTKVTISAVTTVLLCFVIFVLCFFICKKHEILCWSPDCAGPNVNNGNTTMAMEQNNRTSPPTVPMLDVALPSTVNDKDLPPSYDTLFPQTNAVNNT